MTDLEAVPKNQARYGMTIVVGLCATVALVSLEYSGALRISNIAIADTGIRSALFGALLTACGLFITVYLAVLTAVTALSDDRPVVKLMKSTNTYEELIHRLVGPLISIIIVAAACVLCILLRSAPAGTSPEAYRMGALALLPCATVGFGLGLFAQTMSVALLLSRILLHKPREVGSNDTPAAARERLTGRSSSESDDTTSRAHLAYNAGPSN